MRSLFLFPHKYRSAGIALLALALVIMAANYFTLGTPFGNTTYTGNLPSIPLSIWVETIKNDLLYVSIVVGLLFIAFSKESIEDEQISQLRLDSLQWAIYVNYAIFIICIIAFNDMAFLSVIVYNTITPLLFFIIRFRWKIYQLNRLSNNGAI